jgi:hypothetical protein
MHGAGAAAALGHHTGAVAALEQLLALWREGGSEAFRPVFLRWLGRAHLGAGNRPAALRAFDEGIEHVAAFGGEVHLPELYRDRGRTLRADGMVDAAASELRRAVGTAAGHGAWSLALRALADLVDTCPADDAARRMLADCLPRISERQPAADLGHARSLVAS